MMAILSMAYTSTAVSFLTVRKLNPILDSVEYFAHNPDKELVVIKEYQLTTVIMVRFILFLGFCFFLLKNRRTIEF